MRFPWFKPRKPDATRLLELEGELERQKFEVSQLRAEWDEVLEKLTKRTARESALKRKELVKQLELVPEAGEAEPAGEPVTVGVPSKAELWRRARALKA